MVPFFGVLDRQNTGEQTPPLIVLGMHAPDQLQIGDGLADLPVQGVLLADDLLPDPILGADLKGGDGHGEGEVGQHDAHQREGRVEEHLDQGTDCREHCGEDIVAQDLDELAEPGHPLIQLGGLLTAQAAGVVGHRHFQQLVHAALPDLRLVAGDDAVQQHPAQDGDALGAQIDEAKGQDGRSALGDGPDGAAGDAGVQLAQPDRPDGGQQGTDPGQRDDPGALQFGSPAHEGQIFVHVLHPPFID